MPIDIDILSHLRPFNSTQTWPIPRRLAAHAAIAAAARPALGQRAHVRRHDVVHELALFEGERSGREIGESNGSGVVGRAGSE
jgi:hypothetical protein